MNLQVELNYTTLGLDHQAHVRYGPNDHGHGRPVREPHWDPMARKILPYYKFSHGFMSISIMM